MSSYTIIQYYGKSEGRCGYCRSSNSAISYSFHAYQLLPQDYQDLVDRGWRRSGHYTYKPKNSTTCCPCYTIRCDSEQFKLSKSHKKILKRMNKFLKDGIFPNKSAEHEKEGNEPMQEIVDIPKNKKHEINIDNIQGDTVINIAASSDEKNSDGEKKLKTSSMSNASKVTSDENPPRKKAKQIRIEKKKAKLEAKGQSLELKQKISVEKSIRDFVNNTNENDCHKLKVILVPSVDSITQNVFELYKKYQIIVHRDPPSKPTFKQFERFLVKSPLKTTVNQTSSPPQGFGSFHQQYWLDDKLIAVGVLDILPNCVSSVYFFYDPDYSFLSLGTYSSLRELEFTQTLAETLPSLKYYYMGFYIHNCPKMRYKGNLSSSYLLCPESYTYILLDDEVRNLLDIAKYQRLNRNPDVSDVNEFSESSDLDHVLVLNESRYCTYKTYIQVTGDNDERSSIIEYGKLVGKSCSKRMLYLIVPD